MDSDPMRALTGSVGSSLRRGKGLWFLAKATDRSSGRFSGCCNRHLLSQKVGEVGVDLIDFVGEFVGSPL
ncbi:hypothetical protein QJS04_geneDACA004498 [Acorus gramineus]|uniref:Uncharacterized protein n=1 Tax=Acorus gramineus TaxID=55184 RepID=A0AAV9B3S0_ACOGR|nr:hypothetical protein QJS04_geneDACA004498 [Acorus gramineus]